ncbi:MAG: RNA polymerase sigma factor [Desulfobacterales bacterium]
MSELQIDMFRDAVEAIYRDQSRRVLATLIRLLGDFELAEEALHDAFTAALQQWQKDGVPAHPRAWLISTGRFKAIDAMRRRARFDASLVRVANQLEIGLSEAEDHNGEVFKDDMLRLIFTCCHPALSPDNQVALTLREVCGLTTEEIAHAFLIKPTTVAQRIVRAKAKIRDAQIPYEVPSTAELPERLESVLRMFYQVFSEGYFASDGESLTRPNLSGEAICLGRRVVEVTAEPEATGLLALMLLDESRRAARSTPEGDIVPLENQDRKLWDKDQIAEGLTFLRQSLSSRRIGSFTLQAAIAAVHAEASRADETDWGEIVGLYDMLLRVEPSPIVELNRAVAVAMRDGPSAGLTLIDSLLLRDDLADYPFAHAAQAELYRRNGNTAAARSAYKRALALTKLVPEQRLLKRRLGELRV